MLQSVSTRVIGQIPIMVKVSNTDMVYVHATRKFGVQVRIRARALLPSSSLYGPGSPVN